jgi:hypothetical protein
MIAQICLPFSFCVLRVGTKVDAWSVSAIPTRPRLISMLGVDLACHDEATVTMNASALLGRSNQEGLLARRC